MLFPPTPPALPDREGSVGDATVEASVLPGGGSRQPEGGRCQRLWGSPLRGRDRRAARKAWCRRPLSREEPSVPFTRALPLTPSAPHPGWSRVRRGVPAVGEVLRRCLSGAFSKPVGVWGRGGAGGSPPARGLTWGAIPGPRSLGRAATPAVETRAGFPPPSTLASRGRAFPLQQKPKASSGREEAGPGEAAGELPLRAAPLYTPRTKRRSARGHRPGRSAQGGLRRGRKGAASRRGQG